MVLEIGGSENNYELRTTNYELLNMEWVDGILVEKNGKTAKHGRIQARLAAYWIDYKHSSGQEDSVYTETPCRTFSQGGRPDVSYLTPELVEQFSDFTVLPQSFPLIAEIVSPTDTTEPVFGKVSWGGDMHAETLAG